MDVIINRKYAVQEAGDLMITATNKLFALVEDHGEKYPYHLLCLEQFIVLQSYDTLPSNAEIEEDIGEPIEGIYHHRHSKIMLNEAHSNS